MADGFISFEKVKKDYQAGEVTVTALHDVSFAIEKGEICVIVGESGAGKTTLLNILGGVDSLTEGRVTVDGAEVSSFGKKELTAYRRNDVGFVFQFYNLIPNLTALENVEIAAQLKKDSLDPALVLEQVGLKDRMGHFPAQQDTSRSTGMTVIIITHNKALCAMADRVIRVKSGTIRSVQKNEEIIPVEEIEW